MEVTGLGTPELSVVICTRNRAESLGQTLELLAAGDSCHFDFEVVVVDNDSGDSTRAVVESFASVLPIRLISELRRGKSHALNRALEDTSLGDIIAFLDDDMSPEPGWLSGVMATCTAWPDKDFFGGRTPIEWPSGTIPGWVRLRSSIQGWAFSSEDYGEGDSEIPPSEWPPPNNFWVRSSVFQDGLRFASVWITEPQFILELSRRGHRGIRSGRVLARHRIQTRLLDEEVVRKRAVLVGQSFANLVLRPHEVTRPAHLFRKYPVLTRLFCVAQVGLWSLRYLSARFRVSRDARFAFTVRARERLAYFIEILRIARTVEKERQGEMQVSSWPGDGPDLT